MGGVEVRKVNWLEWKVFKRHRSGDRWSRESEEGDDGYDIGLRGGRCMWVPRRVDREFTGEAGGERAQENWDRGRLGDGLVS